MEGLGARIDSRNSLTPFRLNSEKNPNESTKNLQKLHNEDPTLPIIEMIQMRRQLETPRTAQHEIEKNGPIVHFLGVEMGVPP